MEFSHIHVKLPAQQPEQIVLEDFLPIFHRWIQEQSTGELLIDVADYRHIPNGPGVVLIGHQADHAIEPAGGRLGLKYASKTPTDDPQAALAQAFGAVLRAADQLEQEPSLQGKVRFERRQAEIIFNDRLLAPNRPETLRAVQPALERFFAHLPGGVQVNHATGGDARERFAVLLQTTAPLTPPPPRG